MSDDNDNKGGFSGGDGNSGDGDGGGWGGDSGDGGGGGGGGGWGGDSGDDGGNDPGGETSTNNGNDLSNTPGTGGLQGDSEPGAYQQMTGKIPGWGRMDTWQKSTMKTLMGNPSPPGYDSFVGRGQGQAGAAQDGDTSNPNESAANFANGLLWGASKFLGVPEVHYNPPTGTYSIDVRPSFLKAYDTLMANAPDFAGQQIPDGTEQLSFTRYKLNPLGAILPDTAGKVVGGILGYKVGTALGLTGLGMVGATGTGAGLVGGSVAALGSMYGYPHNASINTSGGTQVKLF